MNNNRVILTYKDALMISRIENIPIEYFVGGFELNGVMYFLPSKCMKDYNNLRNKKKRYKEILLATINYSKMFNLSVYFITFTLDDKHIKNDKKTIVRHIKEVFKELSFFKYILNEDYGRNTYRLHYHALVFTLSDISILKDIYLYGFVDIKFLNVDNFLNSIGSYLAKFEKHAYKNTIKLIYSRFNYKHLSIYR